MKNGFTLMEVCVALAVLSAGIVVFGRYLDGFNRLRSLERKQARAVIETAQAVEYFVQNAPACRDTVFAFGAPATAILVSLETVPGAKPLAWLHALKTASQKVDFRRLIHCKRNEPALR